MTTKEYMMRAVTLKRKIKAKEISLKALKECTPYSSPCMDDVRVTSNAVHSAVENAAVRLVALAEEVEADRKELDALLKENARLISSLGNSLEYTLMTMRYVFCLEWEEVINRMGYGRSYIFRLHGEALSKIHIR